MRYWECKIYPKGETWEDTGRTLLLPFSEVGSTKAYAWKELQALVGTSWCLHDAKPVTLEKTA
ncbi:MAG: hypothetical protein E6R03_09425 [Hyphomicrobiaceae bacterium]|nr:MAG: hypothetical protein E6R03_09425 [Hyphomicrobiaceae bacterium]